jgi:FkbM family methyltransferase
MQKIIYYLLHKFSMNDIESNIFKYLSSNEKNIFDIGCFRGNFTKNIIKNENKIKSNFFLFDPNPNTEKYLSNLLKKKNIKYFNLAIDNSNTKKTFHLNKFFESSGSSLQSFAKDDKKWKMTRRIFMQLIQPHKKVEDFTEIEVETKTLDFFCSENNIDKIDLLKIDAEGNELNILLGSEKLLSEKKINIIYVEISERKENFKDKSNEIKRYLTRFGFRLEKSHRIKSLSFLSNLNATDNLFIR